MSTIPVSVDWQMWLLVCWSYLTVRFCFCCSCTWEVLIKELRHRCDECFCSHQHLSDSLKHFYINIFRGCYTVTVILYILQSVWSHRLKQSRQVSNQTTLITFQQKTDALLFWSFNGHVCKSDCKLFHTTLGDRASLRKWCVTCHRTDWYWCVQQDFLCLHGSSEKTEDTCSSWQRKVSHTDDGLYSQHTSQLPE